MNNRAGCYLGNLNNVSGHSVAGLCLVHLLGIRNHDFPVHQKVFLYFKNKGELRRNIKGDEKSEE